MLFDALIQLLESDDAINTITRLSGGEKNIDVRLDKRPDMLYIEVVVKDEDDITAANEVLDLFTQVLKSYDSDKYRTVELRLIIDNSRLVKFDASDAQQDDDTSDYDSDNEEENSSAEEDSNELENYNEPEDYNVRDVNKRENKRKHNRINANTSLRDVLLSGQDLLSLFSKFKDWEN